MNEDNTNLRKELILGTSEDIAEYLKQRYDVVDPYIDLEIAEIINTHLGFLFGTIDEMSKE